MIVIKIILLARFRSGSIRNDRGYDNRKNSGYYDNQHDYPRSYHRDNDQERDRNKDTESRMYVVYVFSRIP